MEKRLLPVPVRASSTLRVMPHVSRLQPALIEDVARMPGMTSLERHMVPDRPVLPARHARVKECH